MTPGGMLVDLTTERTWIADVAFVELDVLFGEVGRIEHGTAAASVQVDVKVELTFGHDAAKVLERSGGGLASFQAPEDFSSTRETIADVDFFLSNPGCTVAQSIDDAAPVRVAAVPTGLY